ncbi:MAG: 50S ribosomal protein L13 [Planctomycetes bacterium]|nr:50S ribosomal protein L13 [Planctomycetota bacterium]
MARFAIQKCFVQNPKDVTRRWLLVDAEKETLGRMAVEIATILMGKHKPTYTPHVDCGDYVVVVNAEKVRLTGRKVDQKIYRHHTGYLGGLREHNLAWMLANKPEDVIKLAVRRMLPKSKLGGVMLKKLKVHAGPDHKQGPQAPEPIHFGN